MNKPIIKIGSKVHKVLLAFNAMGSVCEMAPWGGGLQGELSVAYDILYKMFIQRANECGWTEVEALKFCNQNKI